jgi:hypothetical protein
MKSLKQAEILRITQQTASTTSSLEQLVTYYIEAIGQILFQVIQKR